MVIAVRAAAGVNLGRLKGCCLHLEFVQPLQDGRASNMAHAASGATSRATVRHMSIEMDVFYQDPLTSLTNSAI